MNADPGNERFYRYINTFAEAQEDGTRPHYPGLKSQPWYQPADFPLAVYLEKNYQAIQAELLALSPAEFQRAIGRIKRSGDWDVLFFYERGYRHDDHCDVCPVTMRGIEAYPAMRTVAGLIYMSRMRGRTHITAHRGPTNMRLRCHLALKIPQGDCAIRVGNYARRWQEGKCMIFDDHFEHEAWNHTENERIVLVIDIWHPGLSTNEIALLNGLHGYAYAYARELNSYWHGNTQAC
jgi:aspartyl/asparaginyl beta-hydroxylase (cupin superfamily)